MFADRDESTTVAMNRKSSASSHAPPLLTTTAFAVLVASAPNPAKADIGGMSFWLPGLMGSLAAVPGQPGWGIANIYIHLDTGAGGGKEFQNNGAIVAGLHARA